jgi:hypothetical protein
VQRHLYPVEYMQLNPDMPLNYQRVNLASWIFWPPHPRLQLSAITTSGITADDDTLAALTKGP